MNTLFDYGRLQDCRYNPRDRENLKSRIYPKQSFPHEPNPLAKTSCRSKLKKCEKRYSFP
jgi:hypothetical protein